jgi:hypothetical protein
MQGVVRIRGGQSRATSEVDSGPLCQLACQQELQASEFSADFEFEVLEGK